MKNNTAPDSNWFDQWFKPKYLLIIIISGGLITGGVIALGYWRVYALSIQPTNFDRLIGITPPINELSSKTLWDLFQAITIPVFLAIGIAFIERAVKQIEFTRETDRRKDEKLKEYLKTIENLILEKKLLSEDPSSHVRAIAYAYTRDLVKELDGKRLGALIDLLESHTLKLIDLTNPIIELDWLSLYRIDLSGRKLNDIHLTKVKNGGIYLEGY